MAHGAVRFRQATKDLIGCISSLVFTGCLVAQDLALLTKIRTLIHEEISLLTVVRAPPFLITAHACADT